MKETLLEKAIKITIFFVTIYILYIILKFDIFEKDTLALLLGVFILIGLGDVIDTIVKTYKLIVYYIDKK